MRSHQIRSLIDRPSIVGLILCSGLTGMSAGPALAGPEDWDQCDLYGAGHPPGPNAVAPDTQCPESPYAEGYDSKCWYSYLWHSQIAMNPPETGFPLNINLWQGPGPSDFPPRSLNPILSSSPLVSKEVAHFRGPVPHRERPMLNGAIDLITGVPLLQEVDFELPFGGAVFRHVRTYSERASKIWWNIVGTVNPLQPDEGQWWDWNGAQWMMGENPILLVDSAYPDLTHETEGQPEGRRCYFVPDAHHAIPFVFDKNIGQYIAPPWFDAIMEHSGVVDQNGEWTTFPNKFHVWLQRKSVKYTFKVYKEDHWIFTASEPDWDIHERRPEDTIEGGGDRHVIPNGIPYYGLATQIEDRYGNRAELEYCAFKQSNDDCDLPGSTCTECCQNCVEKGQLRRVRLITADDEVVWTLLYTHRAFRDELIDTENPLVAYDELRNQHALHTIHVYEGNVDVPDDCLTIPASEFCCPLPQPEDECGPESLEDIDAINHPAIEALSQDWVIEARYLYNETTFLDNPICTPGNLVSPDCAPVRGVNGQDAMMGQHLLKATITRRSEQSESPVLKREYSMYRYQRDLDIEDETMFDKSYFGALKALYSNERIQSIIQAYQAANETMDVNTLLTKGDAAEVPFVDSVTGEPAPKSLRNSADFRFTPWGDNPYDNAWQTKLVDEYSSGDTTRTTRMRVGEHRFSDRRADTERAGHFALYYFVQFPEGATIDPSSGCIENWDVPQGSMYHFPYRFREQFCACGTQPPVSIAPQNLSLAEPAFITVIDEVDIADGSATDYSPWTDEHVISRRSVEMNAAGHILRDRTWFFEDDGQQLVSSLGYAEEVEYLDDESGRIKERRTKGWGTSENPDPEANGLVYVYEYHPDEIDPATQKLLRLGELRAAGIKKGSADEENPVYWLSKNTRHEDRPELITEEVVYTTPVESLDATSDQTTYYTYAFNPTPPNPEDRPITAKAVIKPPAPLTAGGASVHPFEKTYYDLRGNVTCIASGSLPELTAPPNGADLDISGANPLFLTGTEFNELGQIDLTIQDASEFDVGGQILERVADEDTVGLPLNLTTDYQYGVFWELQKILMPNGRYQWFVNKEVPGGTESWVYRDVLIHDGTGEEGDPDTFKVLAPIEITEMTKGGRVTTKKSAKLQGGFDNGEPDGTHDLEIISTSTPEYDANGRVVGLTQAGTNDPGAVGVGISYDGFGMINRQEDADGTITRFVYDPLGRPERTYRGTLDLHEYWGTLPPGEPATDNMVLTEKRYYGSGVTNADKLTETRYYRGLSDNQYDEECPECEPNNEDDIGWITLHEYDWRMREVFVTRKNAADQPINCTVTWFDHQNRVRYVAEYNNPASVPSAADPRAAAPDATPPSASVFFNVGLLSLSETQYNDRGLPDKVRQYKIPAGPPYGTPNYTVTKTFYDHADRPVEVNSPGAPIQRYVYDAKGRQVLSLQLAAGVELSRSKTEYDSNDRAIITTRYERRHDASGATLTSANSIVSYTYTWYDLGGRVLASANMGTYSDTYSNSTTPPARGSVPSPAVYDSAGKLTGADPVAVGLDAATLVTCYEYDDEGRQVAVLHPDGTFTRSEYDNLGRLLMTVENADATSAEDRQVTAYRYECQEAANPEDCRGSRLVKIAAVLPDHNTNGIATYDQIDWAATDGSLQVTQMLYDADVLDDTGAPVSEHGAWVSEVRYPGDDGQPGAAGSLSFQYTFDGLVATRTDARGMIFAHTYDELSRRTQTIIDDGAWFAQPAAGIPDWRALDRINEIEYAYLPDGKLDLVTAYTASPSQSGQTLTAQNHYEYDEFDNLKRERQAHAEALELDTPDVEYTWTFSGATDENFNRLTSIIYPTHAGSSFTRAVNFQYGANGTTIDDELNRITKITDSALGDLATYAYMGTSRRVSSTIGPQLNQTFISGSGYDRLDRHGRIADLMFTLDSGSIVHRYKYGYDLAGNRTYAWARQAIGPDGTTTHINDRSYLYTYDDLHRLIDAKLGKLNSTNDGIDPNGPTPRETHWDLDNLGNWSGGDSTNGSVVITEGANTETIHHATNTNNQITQIYEDGTSSATPVHDPAGNLVFDGLRYYQYDAFNRLMQVNLISTAALDSDGKIESGQLGQIVARYMYDGLGRLARKSTPVKVGYDDLQHKDYYYDGVRRIQEVITRPGDMPAIYLNDELPDPYDPNPPASYTTVWTDREYVWGPDYVDELVCQIDRTGAVMYAIQDANYNVVALTDASGAMLEQYTYDPYGTLRVAETYPVTHAVNRVGHQGLFYDRFDGTMDDPSLAPSAIGLYYNRNRSYAPHLGRFMQRDPNGSAISVTAVATMNGEPVLAELSPFAHQIHYADGLNVFQYQQSNPENNQDPTGLNLFEDAEAAEIALTLNYALSSMTLAEGRAKMKVGLRLSIAYMHAAFMWDDYVWEENEQILFDLVLGGLFARACFTADTPVIMSDGHTKTIDSLGLGDLVQSSHVADSSRTQNNSDDPDPTMWRRIDLVMQTRAGGRVHIALLRPDAWLSATGLQAGDVIEMNTYDRDLQGAAKVVSISQCPEIPATDGGSQVVTGLFVTEQASVLDLHFNGIRGPIGTTPSHLFFSADRQCWVSASMLRINELVVTRSGAVALTAISMRPALHTVYNIEINRHHTYYVGSTGLLVHNACGPYSDLVDPPSVGRGKNFTFKQQMTVHEVNRARNGGRLRSDVSGRFLTPRYGERYSAQVDHMIPKARGGTNSYKNAQLVAAIENQRKGAR